MGTAAKITFEKNNLASIYSHYDGDEGSIAYHLFDAVLHNKCPDHVHVLGQTQLINLFLGTNARGFKLQPYDANVWEYYYHINRDMIRVVQNVGLDRRRSDKRKLNEFINISIAADIDEYLEALEGEESAYYLRFIDDYIQTLATWEPVVMLHIDFQFREVTELFTYSEAEKVEQLIAKSIDAMQAKGTNNPNIPTEQAMLENLRASMSSVQSLRNVKTHWMRELGEFKANGGSQSATI